MTDGERNRRSISKRVSLGAVHGALQHFPAMQREKLHQRIFTRGQGDGLPGAGDRAERGNGISTLSI